MPRSELPKNTERSLNTDELRDVLRCLNGEITVVSISLRVPQAFPAEPTEKAPIAMHPRLVYVKGRFVSSEDPFGWAVGLPELEFPRNASATVAMVDFALEWFQSATLSTIDGNSNFDVAIKFDNVVMHIRDPASA
jgi:hypothetical protein